MPYFVYILKSEIRKRYYIGCSENPDKRVVEHNNGGTKSTKPYRPWSVVYREKFADKKEAFKREWHLKHPVGYIDRLKIIKTIENSFGGFA